MSEDTGAGIVKDVGNQGTICLAVPVETRIIVDRSQHRVSSQQSLSDMCESSQQLLHNTLVCITGKWYIV